MKTKVLFTLALGTLATACTGDRRTLKVAPRKTIDPLPIAVPVQAAGKDPLESKQWANTKVGLDDVWSTGKTGSKTVRVAIISTGVDYNHEDLRANILMNTAELAAQKAGAANPMDSVDNDGNDYVDDIAGWDSVEEDGLPFDTIGSGTAAAGIIGAVHSNSVGVKGVLQNVALIPIRYVDASGQSNVPRLLRALAYAYAARADVVYVQLVHFGAPAGQGNKAQYEKVEAAAIGETIDNFAVRGTPIIVNAGNSKSDLSESTGILAKLSAKPNVLVVTSVDNNDKRPFLANFGMKVVSTSAPGEGVMTTLPGNRYGVESGTHIAAAYVTGAVALAKAQFGDTKSFKEVFQALLSENGSDALPDAARFETTAGNRLNVAKFLTALAK